MSGNNRGKVAASHSKSNFVLALEVRIAGLLLNAFHQDLDVGLHSDAGKIDVQFSGDRFGAMSRSLGRGLEHRECILLERVADAIVGMVHVVVAANRASRVHHVVPAIDQIASLRTGSHANVP